MTPEYCEGSELQAAEGDDAAVCPVCAQWMSLGGGYRERRFPRHCKPVAGELLELAVPAAIRLMEAS